MTEFYVQSPTRVDLAGGTLDVGKLYLLFDKAVTVNFAIQVLTHVKLVPKPGKAIHLKSRDMQVEKKFNNLAEFLSATEPSLSLMQTVIRQMSPQDGFDLELWSESPVGGGLGGSSSLTISLLKAFGKWLGHKWSINEMVELATCLEMQVLRKPTGTQDYFPAICGGVNIIEYSPAGPMLKLMDTPAEFLDERFFLVYSGQVHNSGINNWDVVKGSFENDKNVLGALSGLRDVADQTSQLVQSNQWNLLPRVFEQELNLRRQLCPSYISPIIERLYQLVMGGGAQAVKVCGAGGGGCVMVWCQPEDKQKLQNLCKTAGYQVLATQAQARLDISSYST